MSSNSVFISYRREASKYLARAVFQDLKQRGFDVFMDVESIDSGTFDTIILNQIAARPYFLLILTPTTLNRCIEPSDWLLRELSHAMSLNRIIIPMTTPEFSFDEADKYLDVGLAKELRRFNGLGVVHEYFDAGIDKLCNRFLKPVDLVVKPTPQEDKSVVEQKLKQTLDESKTNEDQLLAQSYFERGNKAFAANDYDNAVHYFSEAIKLDSENASSYYNRAVTHFLKKHYSLALADYTEAIKLEPLDSAAYYNRGNTYFELGELEHAISDYSKALSQRPDDSAAYYNRGLAEYELGHYKKSLRDFDQAIELDASFGAAYYNRAIVREALDDQEGAGLDFKQAKKLKYKP